jgi:predicted CXXCH cytochrome family protein
MIRIALISIFIIISISSVSSSEYAGSDACKTCHKDIWEDFMKTGHPYKLRPVNEAKEGNEEFGIRKVSELPEGYTWNDVTYVIGGVWWKTRFVNKTGYIITGDAAQYNIETGEWVPYNPGKVKQYTCGDCHTTGYKKEGHQDSLPGIAGTWVFPGIECEECHGPSAEHAINPLEVKSVVDTSSELCGRCHVRGDPNKIPASGGFIKHHEQYPEFWTSPHKNFNCVVCHDPHKSVRNPMVEDAIRTKCEDCHEDVAREYADSKLAKAGIECVDCHMPFATKSAVKRSEFQGDVRTHLFKINTDPKAPMFTDDGKYVVGDYVTLDFACLYCHTDKDKEWASTYAIKAHGFEVKSTTEVEKNNTPGFETVLAIMAAMAAFYVRRKFR